MRKLDGSAPVRLGEGNGGSLSPDGKWVASAPLTGPPRIVLLPTGIGTAKEITVPLEKVSYPQLFPDNRHVVFIGAERGHAFGCYVQDIESGRLQAVTPEGALLSYETMFLNSREF